MPNLSKTTRDHDEIRSWAEERGAVPSHVKSTGSAGDVGVLRFDFPGYSGEESLEPLDWDEFFEKFDDRGLALVYQEKTAEGQKSNFNKLIDAGSGKQTGRSRGGSGTRKKTARASGSHRGAKKTSSKSASSRTGTRKTATKKSTAKRSGAANKSAARHGAKASPRKGNKRAAAKKTVSKRSSASSGRKRVAAKKRSGRRR